MSELRLTKQRLFAAHLVVDDARLEAVRRSPEHLAPALREAALEWHRSTAKLHFQKPAHDKYDYAPRSAKYLRNSKKRGKPDLVFSGKLRQDILHNAQVKTTKNMATLKMSSRVLNLCGAGDTNQAFTVTVNGHSYPNMKREIKVLLPDEKAALAEVVKQKLADSMNESSWGPEEFMAT